MQLNANYQALCSVTFVACVSVCVSCVCFRFICCYRNFSMNKVDYKSTFYLLKCLLTGFRLSQRSWTGALLQRSDLWTTRSTSRAAARKR